MREVEKVWLRARGTDMATTKRKQSGITGFFSPAPKRRVAEEPAPKVDDDVPHSSVGTATTSSSDESQALTEHSTSIDIADFIAVSSITIPDQVKYRVILERKPLQHDCIPTRTYNDSKRKHAWHLPKALQP